MVTAVDEVADDLLELRTYEQFAIELAHRANHWIATAAVGSVDTKLDLADPVSDVDRFVERQVRDLLVTEFPDHLLSGEEYGSSDGGGRAAAAGPAHRWYLDPIDGTANFVHGVAWSSFSLCLMRDDVPVAAVVSDPWRRRVVSAVRGDGVRLDGVPVERHSTGDEPLAGSLVLTELLNNRHWQGFATATSAVADGLATLRILGSSALSLATMATATHAAIYLPRLNPIDHGAGLLIARESGACLLDGDGDERSDVPEGEVIAATSPQLAREVAAIIRESKRQ